MIISIDMPDDMKEIIKEKADKMGTSMSYVVKDAIYRYFKGE